MRSEKEMLGLILGFAEEDERIRAVMMNGSRVNPNSPRDIFQDYDIVYFVTDVGAFVSDRDWIRRFGELMVMQTPDEMGTPDPDPADRGSFGFLMQFMDGNRIDLTFYPVERMDRLERDSLSVQLLDKDGILEPLTTPSDSDYITKPPSAKQFADCCNEFWWVSTYIAKGLWRSELPYAKYMFEHPVRDMLILMIQWHIGVRTGFSVAPGKAGKYFETYLEPELWEQFVQTYPDAEYEHIWQALLVMGDLFRKLAIGVAEHFGYDYPHDDDRRVFAHLKHIRSLPKDAKDMYQ